MPIYEYRCEQGHTFEVLQRMSDDPLSTCTACDSSVRRLFHPVAVHFKGSGFHNTDYRKRTGAEGGEGGGSGADKKGEGDSSPSDKGEKAEKKGSDSGGGAGSGGDSSGAD